MVQLLVAYKKQHRHPRVPKSAPAPWTELGLWVDRIRALKHWEKLSALMGNGAGKNEDRSGYYTGGGETAPDPVSSHMSP